jgi:hypothetical protein
MTVVKLVSAALGVVGLAVGMSAQMLGPDLFARWNDAVHQAADRTQLFARQRGTSSVKALLVLAVSTLVAVFLSFDQGLPPSVSSHDLHELLRWT